MEKKNRKQVDYRPGKIAANPLIDPIGGTAQTVIPVVPTSNSAQRLTTAINRIPGLLGQAANINMDRGKEAAEDLTVDQINDIIEGKIPTPDGGITGKLGFEKAFEETFAKRYADTTGIEKYSELESSLEADLDGFVKSGASLGTVTAHVTEKVKNLQEELMSHFEDSAHGRKVMNLVTSELSTRILSGATKGYDKKRLAYMRSAKVEVQRNKFTEVLDKNITLKDYIANADKELKGAGLSNEQINSSLRTTAMDGLEVLKDSGRLKEAFVLLEDLEGLSVNNRPFFGSLSDRKSFAAMSSSLIRADKTTNSAESLSTPRNAFIGRATNTFTTLHAYDVSDKDNLQLLEKDLKADILGMYEELEPNLGEGVGELWTEDVLNRLKELKQKKDESAPFMERALQNIIRGKDADGNKLGTGKASDRSETIYNISYSKIIENLREFRNANRFETLEGITPDDIPSIALQAQIYAEDNITAAPNTWWRTTEWGKSNPMPKEVEEAFKKAKEINWLYLDRVDGNLIDEGVRVFKKELDATIRSEIVKSNANDKAKAALKEQQIDTEIIFKGELTSKLKKAARILTQPNEAGSVMSVEDRKESIKEITQDLINEEIENLKSLHKQQRELENDKANLETKSGNLDINPDEVLTGDAVMTRGFGILAPDPLYPKYESISFDSKLQDSINYSKLLRDPNATKEDLDKLKSSFMGNVNVDLRNARASRETSDAQAMAAILRIHGYPQFAPETVANDLELAEQSWAEIRLFKDLEEIADWEERFRNVLSTSDARSNATVEELIKRNISEEIGTEKGKQLKKDSELMLELGIYDQEALNDFLGIQKTYFYQR